MPKALPGATPSPKPHVWESDWLNHPNGGQTCKVCGCSMLDPGAVVRADYKIINGRREYVYRDVLGKTVRSFVELSCPVFVGDPASAAMEAKENARQANTAIKTIEARIVQLEQENTTLRASLESLILGLLAEENPPKDRIIQLIAPKALPPTDETE